MIKEALIRKSYYKTVLTTPDGEKVINDLIRRYGHFNSTTFVQGDSHSTAFNEGQRSVIIGILSHLHKRPNQAIQDYHNQKE